MKSLVSWELEAGAWPLGKGCSEGMLSHSAKTLLKSGDVWCSVEGYT